MRHGCECVLVDPAFVALSPRQLGTWRNLRKRAARSGERGGAWRAWRRAERWVQVAARERRARRDAHVRRVLVNTDAARRDPEADPEDASSEDASSEDASSEDASSEDASVARFEHFASEFWGDLDGELGAAGSGRFPSHSITLFIPQRSCRVWSFQPFSGTRWYRTGATGRSAGLAT